MWQSILLDSASFVIPNAQRSLQKKGHFHRARAIFLYGADAAERLVTASKM